MVPNVTKPCLKLAILRYLPYLIPETPKQPLTGVMHEVNKIILGHLGYCMEYVRAPDEAGGIMLPNGSWTGIMRQVAEQEVNMSGLGLAITYERHLNFDYSEYLYFDGWTASYKRPVLQSNITGFIGPFSALLWVLTFVTLVGVWVTMMTLRGILELCSRRLTRERTASGFLEEIDIDSGIWSVAILLSQSVPKIPIGNALRIITCFWLFVTLILNTVYRSNLKAMLILPKVVLPFDNPEELVESNIPIWIPRGSALHIAGLESPPGSTLARVLSHSISLNQPTDGVWGTRDMLNGKHVKVSPRAAVDFQMHDTFSLTGGKCPSYVMSETLIGMVQLCYIFPKGSPLKEKIDPIVRRLKQFGIMDYEYRKQIVNATECLKPVTAQADSERRPLDLGDFYGVFMLYGAGLLLAIVLFLLEVLVDRVLRKP